MDSYTKIATVVVLLALVPMVYNGLIKPLFMKLWCKLFGNPDYGALTKDIWSTPYGIAAVVIVLAIYAAAIFFLPRFY